MSEREFLTRWWQEAYERESQWELSLLGVMGIKIRTFWSNSKGRNRKRKDTKFVVLVSFNKGKWHEINGHRSVERIDPQITEALEKFDCQGMNPLDFFLKQIEKEVRSRR